MSHSLSIISLALLLVFTYIDIINSNPLSPLCDCYSIVLKNVIENDKNENCWTYSIEFNDALDICKEKRAKAIILGRCEEKPKFNMRKLSKSVMSVIPNNFETKIFKSSRDSLLGLRIRDIDYSRNVAIESEEITLCMRNTNNLGLTSNNIEYKLFNGDVIKCFDSPFHSGLPCFEQGIYDDDVNLDYDDIRENSMIYASPSPTMLPSMSIQSSPSPPSSPSSLAIENEDNFVCEMNNDNIHDICIIFDQSCSLSTSQCDIYLDLISQFIQYIKNDDNDDNNPRLCLLGISSGVQILIDLNDNNNIDEILDLIADQKCGDSNTNLLDALEITQLKFDKMTVKSDYKSLVIFNSCVSTDFDGNFNENDICDKHNSIQTETETIGIKPKTNTYIINIQSLDGSVIGKTNFLPSGNIDPNTYLQCLTENDPNRIISITQNNYNNSYKIIKEITKQICNDHNVNNPAALSELSNNFIDIDFTEEIKELGSNKNKALSETTISVIRFVFVFVMIAIVCNAMCCTFFALRQSGSLDSYFGAINKEIDEKDTNYEYDTSDFTSFDDFDDDDIDDFDDDIDDDTKLKKYLNQRGHGPFSKYNNNKIRDLSIFIQDLNLSEE